MEALLATEQERIVRKKERSKMMLKINAKKDIDMVHMQTKVDTVDVRENALKLKLRQVIIESNMKGNLLLEIRLSIKEMKVEYSQALKKLEA